MAGLTGFPDGLNTEYERKKEFQNDSEVYSLRHNQLREQSSSCGSWERWEEKQFEEGIVSVSLYVEVRCPAETASSQVDTRAGGMQGGHGPSGTKLVTNFSSSHVTERDPVKAQACGIT